MSDPNEKKSVEILVKRRKPTATKKAETKAPGALKVTSKKIMLRSANDPIARERTKLFVELARVQGRLGELKAEEKTRNIAATNELSRRFLEEARRMLPMSTFAQIVAACGFDVDDALMVMKQYKEQS